MLKATVWLLVGVCVWGFASCSITCPDGNVCSDFQTCCKTESGYSCCPYPKAVCCSDRAHCCPSGFLCNLATQMCEKKGQPWLSVPMGEKEEAANESPLHQQSENNNVLEQQKSTIVQCDTYHACPDGTTCCRHPKGAWFCCPYSPGRCCLDGFHCCPYPYDCDLTYTHCVLQSPRYPFPSKQAMGSFPASPISPSEDKTIMEEKPLAALTEANVGARNAGVIRCNSEFYCASGQSCCKGSTGRWNCCPYPLASCCADGKHCCEFGYTCDPTSMSCKSLYSQTSSGAQEPASKY